MSVCCTFVAKIAWFILLCALTHLFQDVSAVAKAWEDSPYLFIVRVQSRGVEDEDVGTEQPSFAFTSEKQSFCKVKVDHLKWA